jgi:isopentenyl diphosphate isomerase/L-lactate dehydrogenase-like FMN-dependent dehydrogenase
MAAIFIADLRKGAHRRVSRCAFDHLDGAAGGMIDSGVRSGEDIAEALAIGADFVLLRRSIMYGAAALLNGTRKAIALVKSELDNASSQMGRRTLAEPGPNAMTTTRGVRSLAHLDTGGARCLAGLVWP